MNVDIFVLTEAKILKMRILTCSKFPILGNARKLIHVKISTFTVIRKPTRSLNENGFPFRLNIGLNVGKIWIKVLQKVMERSPLQDRPFLMLNI